MNQSFSSPGSLTRRIVACIGTLLVLIPLFGMGSAAAQSDAPDEVVIFVMDLSGSMNEPFDGTSTKLDAAKAAFVEAFANVSDDARVGLRTYGDQIEPTEPAGREASCTTDTRLVTPVASLQRQQLISQVQGFSALGDTPMGLAIQQASADIPAGSTGTIVLFSDGRDECFDADLDGDPAVGPSFGQDPCEIAKSVTSGDAAVDRIVTVGFGADSAAETELRCIADSTGGSYTAILTPEDARNVLPELLVQLSAPREAQRLVGREIRGADTTEDAPDFVRLDEVGAQKVLYTDTIDMNSKRIYRMADYGPEGGTFTATVFGLPPTLGIELDMQILVPELDQRFFEGEHGDFDAGIPARPTASIRCTDCKISGGPYEAFFVVSLETADKNIEGSFELELLTEGPGFGGPTTSCSAPQACFYPQEIIDRSAELDAIRAELDGGVGELAPQELIDERNRLREVWNTAQAAQTAAEARSAEIAARLPLAPEKSNSYTLPLLLILLGAGLAFAPWQKLQRPPKDDDDDADGDNDGAGSGKKKRKRKEKPEDGNDKDGGGSEAEADNQGPGPSTMVASDSDRTGPSLDVGPPPAVSPNRVTAGNNWDAELEAAKAALAQQRPERQQTSASPSIASPIPDGPPGFGRPGESDKTISGQFTAAQHAAAQVAAEKIAAQRAARAEAERTTPTAPMPPSSPPASPTATPSANPQTFAQEAAVQAATPEQIAALQTAVPVGGAEPDEARISPADAAEPLAMPAAPDASLDQANVDAEKAAHEEAERATAEQADADKAAAERAAAEQATAERATADKAAAEQADVERAAAEQASAAKEAAEQAAAARAAADKAAIEAAEAAAQQATAHAAAEQAAREAAEQAAAEQAAAERAAREAAERAAAEQAAAEKAAREAAEQAAQEAAAREAAERAAREEADRLAAEKAAAEKAAAEEAARIAAEKVAREAAEQAAAERLAAERAAAEKAAAEEVARIAAEKAAAERAAREAAEQAAQEAAAREAAEKAAAEEAARIAAEKAAAEKAAAEEAARIAAEKAAAEKAAAEKAAAEKAAREAAERLAAERAAAERAATERAAAEEAARQAAERLAAERAAAEKAATERAAAEEAAAAAAAQAAADRAAAEKAAAERAASEQAAREAAAQREQAEKAAAEAAALRAAEEAAAAAAAQAAATAAAAASAAPSQTAPAAPQTEEERRAEARRRMLAKQNIVASSSGPPPSGAVVDTAGTQSALRPMTVPPAAAPGAERAARATPETPGWYEDPAIVGQFRWWDGANWTGHTNQSNQAPEPS